MPGLSVFPSGCEGKLGVALESLQGLRDLLKLMSIGDAIQSSHPLLSPSPPAFNLSQYWGLTIS